MTAEAVEHLGLAAAGVGFGGLLADTVGEVAGEDGGAQESEQSDPVLGVGDCECVDGRQKEEVEEECSGDGGDDGVTKAPVGREDEDQDQQRKRDGGGVDAGEVAIESYNTG